MFNSLADVLDNITPEIYNTLKRAVELGKWPNGLGLTQEQRQLCMQALIAWEETNLAPEQRSGYIPPQSHTHCGSTQGEIADDDVKPLPIRQM